MSLLSLTPAEAAPPVSRSRAVVHWAGLLVVLLAECVLLGAFFDASTLVRDGGWWGGLAEQTKVLSWLATSTVTGLLIFGTAQLRERRLSLRERVRCPRVSWWLLIVHFVGFIAFALVTGGITSGGLQHTQEASALLLIWLGAGLFTLLSWTAAVLPGTGFGVVLASAVIGLVAWLMGGCTLQFWAVLKYAVFAEVRALLSLLVTDVVCEPDTATLGTSTFRATVGSGCSGCEGIGLIWVCLGLYLWCYRRDLRWPWALLLLPVGTALVWVANTLRITVLICLGTWVSPDIALGGFHSQAGWLTFNAIALGLIAVTQRGRFFARNAAAAPERAENPAAPFLAPLLVLVAATMLTSALSDDFDVFYPLRVVVVGSVLLLFRPAYKGWLWSWSWQAVGIGGVAFVLWMALEYFRGAPSDEGLRTGLASLPTGWAVAWVVVRVVGSVVTVPLAEELGFRGYLLRRLVSADFREVSPAQFTWAAVIVSSALFGLLHGRWLAGMLVGLLYALALYRRGRVGDAVLAHAVTNGLIAAYVLATRTWSLWC
jgi:exosortase E/protease (VPEID-CTERM system)